MLPNLVNLNTLKLVMPLPGNVLSTEGSSFCKLQCLCLSSAGSSTDPLKIRSLSNLQELIVRNCHVRWPPEMQFTQLTTLMLVASASPAVMVGMPRLVIIVYRPHCGDPDRQGAELLPVLQQLPTLRSLDVMGCVFAPDLAADDAAYPSMVEQAAQRCAALTASTQLERLDLVYCIWPAGAMCHMFPAERQLLELRELKVSILHNNLECNWWRSNRRTKHFNLVAGPGDVLRVAKGCPHLQKLSLLWTNDLTLSELRALTWLTALTKLGVAGDAWNDEAAQQVLAHMPGEAGLEVINVDLL
jgi:hypothetical protein